LTNANYAKINIFPISEVSNVKLSDIKCNVFDMYSKVQNSNYSCYMLYPPKF